MMPLIRSRRRCQPLETTVLTARRAAAELLGGDPDAVESDFQTMIAPAPPNDQTRFRVYRKANRLLVAIVAFDTRPAADAANTLELHFDPHRDRLGRVQFVFAADGSARRHTFLPYPEYHSSRYRIPRLLRWQAYDERIGGASRGRGVGARWIMAWFDVREVVPNGRACGFNVCRHRNDLPEHSAWQYPAGNGFQDACDYGELQLDPPATSFASIAWARDRSTLTFHARDGEANAPPLHAPASELVDPLGQRHPIRWTRRANVAEAQVTLARCHTGRYRLRVGADREGKGDDAHREQWHFDLAPDASATNPFTVAFTADPPVNMRMTHYTPARLDEEMAAWAHWGVDRLYWIDKGSGSAPPNDTPPVKRTYRACGDLLAAMVRACRANRIEPWAVFKTFDLTINKSRGNAAAPVAHRSDDVRDLENRPIAAIPELLRQQHATMRGDDGWATAPDAPVTTLRFFSLAPIPELATDHIDILVSEDNRTYRPYRGAWRLKQGTMRRRHHRWTPAGKQREAGRQVNHYLELSGLEVTSPYVVVRIRGCEARLSHRLFMLAEALDRDDVEQPLTLADEGDAERGLVFWKQWRTWVNRDEPPLESVEWPLREIGLTLQRAPNAPTLLEPSSTATHRIWLDRIARQLDADVAGVDIRTLCHHNTVPSYLGCAFAPAVRERFEVEHGRPPSPTPKDYQRIRELRGQAYTEFLRQASTLVRGRRARLAVHLESGMEVPSHFDTRMQIHWDWRTWIEERLVDEVTLKWFTAHSHFVHEQVLPLCRRHDIPVHVCSRNLDRGPDLRGMELLPKLVREAQAAGFNGYNFYETANFALITPTGRFLPRANTAHAVPAASAAVKRTTSAASTDVEPHRTGAAPGARPGKPPQPIERGAARS